MEKNHKKFWSHIEWKTTSIPNACHKYEWQPASPQTVSNGFSFKLCKGLESAQECFWQCYTGDKY